MRYQIEHMKRNSKSPCNHLLFCLPYKHLTYNEKPTEFTYKNITPCQLFMALNKTSNMPAADWLSPTREKLPDLFQVW